MSDDYTIPGVGEQHPQPDPRGVLVFRGLPPELQASEDATQANDVEVLRELSCAWGKPKFARPATPAERALLEHLGYTLPDDLNTVVTFSARGVRHRAFPKIGA